MNSYFIDTHAHLYEKDVYNIKDLIFSLLQNNIKHVLLPGTCISDDILIKQTVSLNNKLFFPMIGVHPDNIKEDYKNEIKIIYNKISDYNYIAIGEVGLDYYNNKDTREYQIGFLNDILDVAIDTKLPVSIHCRCAFDDMYDILKEKSKRGLKGVIHCFTGSIDEAKKYIDLGFYLGIGGIVTFKNSNLPKVLSELLLDNIVLETDSPYLSPEPLRGKVNSSLNLVYIANCISNIYNIKIDDVLLSTNQNAKKIFNII